MQKWINKTKLEFKTEKTLLLAGLNKNHFSRVAG